MKEGLRNVLMAGFLTGGALVAESPPVNAGGGPCEQDCGPNWPYVYTMTMRTVGRDGYNVLYDARFASTGDSYVLVRDDFFRLESTTKLPWLGWKTPIGSVKGIKALSEECEVRDVFPHPYDKGFTDLIVRVAAPQCLRAPGMSNGQVE